jgi:hypothetical protein
VNWLNPPHFSSISRTTWLLDPGQKKRQFPDKIRRQEQHSLLNTLRYLVLSEPRIFAGLSSWFPKLPVFHFFPAVPKSSLCKKQLWLFVISHENAKGILLISGFSGFLIQVCCIF